MAKTSIKNMSDFRVSNILQSLRIMPMIYWINKIDINFTYVYQILFNNVFIYMIHNILYDIQVLIYGRRLKLNIFAGIII